MYSAVALVSSLVLGHGAMVFPAPRSAHNQTYDSRNKCGSSEPYSNASNKGIDKAGQYCGIGCLGDACLYYQIGCYAGCPTCSLYGKDLYPTPEDIKRAPGCVPAEPTLGGGDPVHEKELRTNNPDGLSERGDWTKPNPWRSPGTAGKGNPDFSPCGVMSGSSTAFPDPPTTANDVPKGESGVKLPSLGVQAKYKAGEVVDVAWALYANHGGGYSYRLCKVPADGSHITEAACQENHLDFVGNQTEIRYVDGSRKPFSIDAVTTSVGTHPEGSMWRKNPVPMCNCDLGYACKNYDEDEAKDGPNPDYSTMFKPYPVTNFHPGQTGDSHGCPTGVQYSTKWDDGMGRAPFMPGTDPSVGYMFMMVDQVKIPDNLEAGDYVMSWRWDCEETPQVWNSCSDVVIA